MNAPITIFRDTLNVSDLEYLRGLTFSTGFFNQEECEIVEDLVKTTLDNPDSGYLWLVAEENNLTVGFTCFGRVPGSLHAWDLYWIVVRKEYQSKGIGKRLLSLTEQAVREQGGKLLIAETSGRTQYNPTRSFYLKCGYKPEATIAEFYGPGDDKVFFVKRF